MYNLFATWYDNGWNMCMMDDVITNTSKQCSTNSAQTPLSENDGRCVVVLGNFANSVPNRIFSSDAINLWTDLTMTMKTKLM